MALTKTFQAVGQSTSALSTYTFSAQAIGAVTSDRYVVVVVAVAGSSGSPVLTCTLDYGSGALPMLKVDALDNAGVNSCSVALFLLPAPSGNTTGNFVITASISQLQCVAGIWTITGSAVIAVLDHGTSSANPLTKTLITVNGGVTICGGAGDAGLGNAWTPTNVTEDYDVVELNNLAACGDSATNAGSSLAITLTPSAAGIQDLAGVFASFQGIPTPAIPFYDPNPLPKREVVGY